MKLILQIVEILALLGIVVPPLMYFWFATPEGDELHRMMLLSTIVWFVAAPFKQRLNSANAGHAP